MSDKNSVMSEKEAHNGNSGWKNLKLSDIISLIGGGTPKRSKSEYWGGEIPWLSVKDFNNDSRYVSSAEESITELGLEKSSTNVLSEGNLIISARGTVGALAQLTKPMAFNQSCYGIDAKLEYTNNDYLYYLVKFSVGNFKQITHGAVFDTITRETFDHIIVDLPPIKKQYIIANILGSLDDKIEINRRINQTLEDMAQAIFKSWFVNFDPVKAKISVLEAGGTEEEANFAAMQVISGKDKDKLSEMKNNSPEKYAELKGTAELFPAAMIDSELGEIPEGWEITNFGSVSQCFDKERIPLSKKQRCQKKGDIPYYGATSVMDHIGEYIFDGVYLLVGEDGSVVKEDGTPFTQYIWGKSWVNNHAHVLQGNNGISTEQLLIFIQLQNMTPFITGAVQLKINQRNLNSIPFLKANKDINLFFQNKIGGLYDSIRHRNDEIDSLIKLRDKLLPKLISGEISVGD